MDDGPIIISDDPSVPPTQNVEAVVNAGGGNASSQVSGFSAQGREETPDQSGMDTLIQPPTPANLTPDESIAWYAPTPGDQRVELGGGGNPVGAGSLADGVVSALQAGYTWNEINNYLSAAQPLNGGEDKLVSGQLGGKLLEIQRSRPSLSTIWFGGEPPT